MLLLLVLCNLLAAGAALVGANEVPTNPGSLVTFSSPVAVAAAENADAVELFYAAVNEAIRTGDTDPLDALVAPDVDWCLPCPGQAADRAGLKRYVADLHRASPEMRLLVDEVVGSLLEMFTVRVRVSGHPVAGATSPWGPVDTLRLVDGEIAERRNGLEGATLAEPLLGARLDALPPAVTGVVLARLTFAVGSGTDGLLSAGPTLLVVESGALWIRIAYDGQILRAGGQIETGDDAYATSGGVIETVLRQGDGAIVPAAVRHSLRQDGTEPGAVLAATLAIDDNGVDRSGRRHPEVGVFEFFDSKSLAPDSPPPAVQMLVRERVDTWSTGPVSVAIGRVILGLGARVFLLAARRCSLRWSRAHWL